MKNIIYGVSIFAGLLLTFSSCKKEEIGNTATEKLAGEWYVTVSAVDNAGNVVYEDDDLFGIGHFHLNTYNTASNSASEIWIDDLGNFWEFKGKINGDVNALTFSGTDVQNVTYDSKFSISEGKILEKAATTPSGSPADSIVFNISFDDDTNLPIGNATGYRIAGYRYTGLAGDE